MHNSNAKMYTVKTPFPVPFYTQSPMSHNDGNVYHGYFRKHFFEYDGGALG